MSATRQRRRYLTRIGGAVFAVMLMVGFVWFVRTMMAGKSAKAPRQVQVVQIIKPPPPAPPPPDQPPPPPQKTDEPLPKDTPEPAPNDEPPPAEPMGIDAQGTAGGDAFGLAAKHGGSDLVGGSGHAIFAWFTNRLKDAIAERLSADPRLASKKFSLSVRVWIEPDGRIRQVKLSSTTGDHELDQRIEAALAAMPRMQDLPPLEMPQPVSLKIVSRT